MKDGEGDNECHEQRHHSEIRRRGGGRPCRPLTIEVGRAGAGGRVDGEGGVIIGCDPGEPHHGAVTVQGIPRHHKTRQLLQRDLGKAQKDRLMAA